MNQKMSPPPKPPSGLERFFSGFGSLISGHLKGGVVWLYLGGGAIFLGMWGYINFLEARLDKTKAELRASEAVVSSQEATVKSQSRQTQRREISSKEESNVQAEINSAPNPIDYTYSWLLDYRSDEADNPDE